MVEDIEGMPVQDMGRTKLGYHVQKAKLPHVEDSRGGDRAREEVYGWCRGAGVEPLELL